MESGRKSGSRLSLPVMMLTGIETRCLATSAYTGEDVRQVMATSFFTPEHLFPKVGKAELQQLSKLVRSPPDPSDWRSV